MEPNPSIFPIEELAYANWYSRTCRYYRTWKTIGGALIYPKHTAFTINIHHASYRMIALKWQVVWPLVMQWPNWIKLLQSKISIVPHLHVMFQYIVCNTHVNIYVWFIHCRNWQLTLETPFITDKKRCARTCLHLWGACDHLIVGCWLVQNVPEAPCIRTP